MLFSVVHPWAPLAGAGFRMEICGMSGFANAARTEHPARNSRATQASIAI